MSLTSRRNLLIGLVALAWLPLLLLSLIAGRALAPGVALPFLEDFEIHARLLLGVPLLLVAERRVHARLNRITELFLERDLVREEDRERYQGLVASSMKLRESLVAKLLLLALVYGVTVPFVWRQAVALDVTSWYAMPGAEGATRLTAAGWWAACVSQPLFQFLLLQWYFRLLLWARFLFKVSRLELRLVPTHPDGTAGLEFLTLVVRAYSLVMMAQGAVLAGMMANRIFHAGATLAEFKLELVGIVALMVLAVLGPLLFFHPQLRRARRIGLEDLGALGQAYGRDFDRRWQHGQVPADRELLGAADIQSLADLRNSYLVVADMRRIPFSMKSIMTLVYLTLLPVAPLLLTMFSAEELVERVLKSIF